MGLFITHTFLLDRPDVDTAGHWFCDGPVYGDNEQAVLEFGPLYPHAVRKQERPLELPRRDAAMQVVPRAVFGLPTAHDELIILPNHFQIVTRETGHRNRDGIGLGARSGNDAFDIVGRVSVGRLGEPVEPLLERIEPQEKRGGKQRNA